MSHASSIESAANGRSTGEGGDLSCAESSGAATLDRMVQADPRELSARIGAAGTDESVVLGSGAGGELQAISPIGESSSANPLISRSASGSESGQADLRTGGQARTLRPATYYVEMHFSRPMPDRAPLLSALTSRGWERIILDQRDGEPGGQADKRTSGQADPDYSSRQRFIGTLSRSVRVRDSESVRWSDVEAVGIDVHADLQQNVTPFELEPGQAYELRWTSRLRQSSRVAVQKALEIMKWKPERLIALKKNMKLPGIPNASTTLWYGTAVWGGPRSFVVSADPLFFEDVRAIGSV